MVVMIHYYYLQLDRELLDPCDGEEAVQCSAVQYSAVQCSAEEK